MVIYLIPRGNSDYSVTAVPSKTPSRRVESPTDITAGDPEQRDPKR